MEIEVNGQWVYANIPNRAVPGTILKIEIPRSSSCPNPKLTLTLNRCVGGGGKYDSVIVANNVGSKVHVSSRDNGVPDVGWQGTLIMLVF